MLYKLARWFVYLWWMTIMFSLCLVAELNLPLHNWEIFVVDMVSLCGDKEWWTLSEIYFENVHENLWETKTI